MAVGFRYFFQRRRESTIFARIVPAIIAIICLFVSKAPMGLLFGVVPVPSLLMIAIFFWAVIDDGRLPISFIFCLGLLEDFLSGTPAGLWALALTLLHIYVSTQGSTLAARSFTTNWISFSILSFVAYLIVYTGVSLQAGQFPPIAVILVPYIFTLIIFPLMTRFFGFLEYRLNRMQVSNM